MNAEFTEAKSRFNEEKSPIYNRLKEELSLVEDALKDAEYNEAQKTFNNNQQELVKVSQQFQFTKSIYDELYYLYKKAQHEGNEGEYQEKKARVDELFERMNQLRPRMEEAALKRDESKWNMEKFTAEADSLKNAMSEMTKNLDRIENKLKTIKNRPLKIEQWILKDFNTGEFGNLIDRVDRCKSCHLAIDESGFEDAEQPFKTHPQFQTLLATHPPGKFGCTPCHGGQGPALDVKAAHGEVEHWQHPLLKQTYSEASCVRCHMDRLEIPHGEVVSTAKKMLTDAGCFGCHDIKGFYDLEKVGPNLKSLASKVKPEWIFNWLKNPKDYLPNTTMPNFLLSDEEGEAVTAYLMDISKQSNYTQVPSPVESGSPERGKWLVENIGCRSCHITGDDQLTGNPRLKEGNNYGPELNRVGSKVNPDWLFDWLKDPKNFRPKSRMPNMRLTDQEAMDIVSYLMTLNNVKSSSGFNNSPDITLLKNLDSKEKIKQGEKITRSYGCFGCHEIKGMENEKKVSVELSDFADKTAEELFFGDAMANGIVLDETWEDWIIGKLKNSRVYATEMVKQKMPNFEFSDENAKILTVLLKSFNKNSISEEYIEKLNSDMIALEEGRLRLRRYNCKGCHKIEGQGGDIASQLVRTFAGEGKSESEAMAFAPPSLEGEGEKVQPDWLFRFIKDPFIIRPWLRFRMPTFYFTDEETIILERYFSKLANQEFKYEYVKKHVMPKEELRAAKLLFSSDYFNCFSCHQMGDKKPEGPPSGWAPDLALARQRLKPEWILKWISDPQKIQPGTRMPAYYPDAYPDDLLDGDPDKQIKAMKDYLMHLGQK